MDVCHIGQTSHLTQRCSDANAYGNPAIPSTANANVLGPHPSHHAQPLARANAQDQRRVEGQCIHQALLAPAAGS